jgi:hypothetical protein
VKTRLEMIVPVQTKITQKDAIDGIRKGSNPTFVLTPFPTLILPCLGQSVDSFDQWLLEPMQLSNL